MRFKFVLMGILGFSIGAVAVAQDSGGENDVTVTFELTLQGDIPADQQFTAVYYPFEEAEPSADHPHPLVQLCGPALEIPEFVTTVEVAQHLSETCRAGEVYTFSVSYPRGTRLLYAFDRTSATDPELVDTFYRSDDGDGESEPSDFVTLKEDRILSSSYSFND